MNDPQPPLTPTEPQDARDHHSVSIEGYDPSILLEPETSVEHTHWLGKNIPEQKSTAAKQRQMVLLALAGCGLMVIVVILLALFSGDDAPPVSDSQLTAAAAAAAPATKAAGSQPAMQIQRQWSILQQQVITKTLTVAETETQAESEQAESEKETAADPAVATASAPPSSAVVKPTKPASAIPADKPSAPTQTASTKAIPATSSRDKAVAVADLSSAPSETQAVASTQPETSVTSSATTISSLAPSAPLTSAPAATDSLPTLELNAASSLIQNWAKAWSDQDVDAYLGFYDDTFIPAKGLSLPAWKKQRQQRLTYPKWISVETSLHQLQKSEPGKATIRFLQHYRSGKLDDRIFKVIDLEYSQGQWQIVREQVSRP